MNSHKKLELSKETLRCLTSDLPSERLAGVRGGGNASLNTCIECVTTQVTTIIPPTWVEAGCWQTR